MGIGIAHARINLIGEHLDYNGGPVLPTALGLKTRVEIQRRSDSQINVMSNHKMRASYELGAESPTHSFTDYFQGVTALARKQNLKLTGLDIGVESDIPFGAGISSSAALLIALLRAFDDEFQWKLTNNQIIRLAVAVENEFVGAKVGVMDPLACLLCEPHVALHVNTRDLSTTRIAMPQDLHIGVLHTGISHKLSQSHDDSGQSYNQRRTESESAAKTLGIELLSDATANDLKKLTGIELKRARHVVSETQRVSDFIEAMKINDLTTLGRLLLASHWSLSSDYEVSLPQIDDFIRATQELKGILGARMIGGGFGGSVIWAAKASDVQRLKQPLFELAKTHFKEPRALA